MDWATLLQLLDSTIRLATPLLLACLAGLFSERAGIFDIGLEGKMLASAFLAAAVAFATGSVWLGLLVGIAGSLLLSAVHGVASITFRGNQLISGVAINFLAAGLTVVAAQAFFGEGGRTPQLSGDQRFGQVGLPGADALRDVPLLGPLYAEVVSGHTILVYVAALTVPLSWWVLYRTRFGLRLRAVGENPAAVDTAGISVARLRFSAVAIAGVLLRASAGAQLSTAEPAAGFVPRHDGGARLHRAGAPDLRQVAAPSRRSGRASTVRFLQALALRPAPSGPHRPGVQVQLLDALPTILTVVIPRGLRRRAVPPRAGGEPYVKER
jgi:simple sugar transport system permease protein